MKEFLNRFFDVYFPGSEITDYFYGLMTSVLSETTEELQVRLRVSVFSQTTHFQLVK